MVLPGAVPAALMRVLGRAGAALATPPSAAALVRAVAQGVATIVVVAGVAIAALAPGAPLAATCAGAGPNHAALVVEHGDGSVVTRCVAFDTASITGEQLLDSSGVAWSGQTFGGYGRAVCALDSEPIHYASCPGGDSYWAVFNATGAGRWQLSALGISSLKLADGDALGFRYVSSSGDPAPPPPAAGVCSGSVAVAAAAVTAGAASRARTAAGAVAGANAGAGGLDVGTIAAVLVGVGLAGLALLRVLVARRRST
jgi:hypothetical protein